MSVSKHKLNGTGRTWNATLAQVDVHGHWLFCPACEEGRDLQGHPMPPHSTDGIQLIVPGAWWTAWWWDDPRWVAIDVAEPITIETADRHAYRDLELDLWWRDGECGIVDQDELSESLRLGLISSDIAKTAESVAEELLVRLQSGDPLFTTLGFHHLDAAIRGIDRAPGDSNSPNGV